MTSSGKCGVRVKVLVSACILGENCKYNGGNNANQQVIDFLKDKEVIPICPEILTEMKIPRPCVELVDGVVMDENGNNVDSVYTNAVKLALSKIENEDIDLAILQSRSPTCGVNRIYDGSFSGKLIPGMGLFAKALKQRGYKVIDIETFIAEMTNPWEEISLSDYENHMKSDSVMQLQNMNKMMKSQFDAYSVNSVMILGIAGGNGLEHIDKKKFRKVYGVDINREYLTSVMERYPDISDILECIQLNLIEETGRLPKAELLIANLLIEYIGYECFKKAVKQVQPAYVSCIIQINADERWVSDSPYIHVFNNLDKVYHQIEEGALIQTMKCIGYAPTARIESLLPNGKKLVQLDFGH